MHSLFRFLCYIQSRHPVLPSIINLVDSGLKTGFRVLNKSMIIVQPSFPAESFYNQTYRSKEFLHSERHSFFLPKASPLKVRFVFCLNMYLLNYELYLISHQGHFLFAVSRWIESGIMLKMEQDVKDATGLKFWDKPKTLENEVLLLEHTLASFIICMSGLSLSILIFVMELIICKIKDMY